MIRPLHILLCGISLLSASCSGAKQDVSPEPTEVGADFASSPEVMAPGGKISAATAQPSQSVAAALSGEGVQIVRKPNGSTTLLAFGTARRQAVDALDALFPGQTRETSRNEECGAGPLEFVIWSGGLAALFQDGKFAGWALNDTADSLTTMAGIGIGSTRTELAAAYDAKVFKSTLGTEFSAGDLGGILDGSGPESKITNLWAGTSCNFR